MKVGHFIFTCRFDSQALLPVFKGSTLRGAFGHALKRITCALRNQQCNTCLLSTNCVYAYLFEVKTVSPPPSSPPVTHRPHPYILIPPTEEKRAYRADDTFSFTLALFGRANEYLPHIVYAVREMGKAGIGKSSPSQGRFHLESIDHGGASLLLPDGSLILPDSIADLQIAQPPTGQVTSLVLTCETPLRLKQNNRFQTELPFHLVIRAALRRISTLEATYGDGEPVLDYKGLAARATAVQSIIKECHWKEIERYSNRQKTTMRIGGLLGSNTYQGENLAEFLPLLQYCEATNMGKQTSFGLGHVLITSSTSP